MTDRKKKLIIMIALIAVVGVSIGFAAFSSSLLIKSSLSVDPDSSTFSVVFSSSSTALETNAITPTVNPTTLTASSATINNSGKYPTIENLEATFTEPGDSVSYTFYARNTGKYDAYLTSIVFQDLTSGVFKECIPGEGTDKTLVASACNSISATVTVGSESATSTTLGIADHELLQGNSETVTITLSYASNGTRADGPFEVNFGNIYLTYGTQETSEMPVLPGATICTGGSGSTALGTKYTCKVNSSESYDFYVLSTEGNNVNLLMSENLEDDVVFIDESNITEVESLDGTYSYEYTGTPYAITYTETLTKNWTKLSQSARLPKFAELANDYVCEVEVEKDWNVNHSLGYYYEGCPEWSKGDYWTSTTEGLSGAWAMNTEFNTLDSFRVFVDSSGDIYKKTFGIRPVITVSTSDLS